MKLRNSFLGPIGWVLLSASVCANAGLQNRELQWRGEGGYVANVMFSYDDQVPTPSEPYVYGYGSSPTHGVEDLMVSFYGPDRTLLYSVDDVVDGVSLYDYLNFTFDTVLDRIVGDATNSQFNLGMDSAPGNLFVAGEIGGPSYLYQVYHDDINDELAVDTVDSIGTGTQFVPEPTSLALLAIGLAGLKYRTRKTLPLADR